MIQIVNFLYKFQHSVRILFVIVNTFFVDFQNRGLIVFQYLDLLDLNIYYELLKKLQAIIYQLYTIFIRAFEEFFIDTCELIIFGFQLFAANRCQTLQDFEAYLSRIVLLLIQQGIDIRDQLYPVLFLLQNVSPKQPDHLRNLDLLSLLKVVIF